MSSTYVRNAKIIAFFKEPLVCSGNGGHFEWPGRHLSACCFLACISFLLLPRLGLAEDPVCPIERLLDPPNHSETLVVPAYPSGRPLIANDYVVIEYNAAVNQGSWSDYHHALDGRVLEARTYPLNQPDSFLPVIYTKEKVAVRVCGFHFTDVVSVTTAVNGVPEGVADVRGIAPVTPPAALSTTFDTLQSGVPTGGTTILPGLGLGPPATLPSLSISGINPGSLGPETSGQSTGYTPATVSASGKQAALLLYSVARSAMELRRQIKRTIGEEPEGNAPGSVKGVSSKLHDTLVKLREPHLDPGNYVAFDQDLIDVQNVNAQISTLASALSSQAFASNALTLLANYSTLTGILDLAKLGVNQKNCHAAQPPPGPANLSSDELKKLDFNTLGHLSITQVISLTDDQIKLIPNDKKDPQGRTVQDRAKAFRAALLALGIGVSGPTGDQPVCSLFEKQKLTDFWNSYNDSLKYLGREIMSVTDLKEEPKCPSIGDREFDAFYAEILQGKPNNTPTFIMDTKCFEGFVGDTLTGLNLELANLRKSLRNIDKDSAEIYDRMYHWNSASSIEHTDLLLPLPQNSDLKVSIVVQRGYTPFTLSNPNGTITPAVSANVVPQTPGTPSTSTPAHATRVIHLQVHRLANFNLVGGPLLIHIPTGNFGVQASPAYATPVMVTTDHPTGYTGKCGGKTVNVPVSSAQSPTAPVSYSCIVQTQQTEWQVQAMAGLTWFPFGHDYYPRRLGFANFGRNLLPSFLLATSFTSLGNAMGGINWEPIGGMDFYAGIASAHKTTLPSGLGVNTAVVSGTTSVTQVTQEHVGFAIGIGFDLSTITSVFNAKTTQAGLP